MSAFADSFVIVGLQHDRCEKPATQLAGQKHFEFRFPDPVGKVHLDMYADWHANALYTRLVRMLDGEVAWYRVSEPAQPPHTGTPQ